MKKIIAFTLTAFILVHTQAQVQLDSKISDVVVYQSRAEITRTATIQLTKGEHELVFRDVSTYIDPANIQVYGKGRLTLLGIRYQQNYLNPRELPAELQKIKEQIATLDLDIQKKKNAVYALKAEKGLLEKNRKIEGAQGSLNLENLKAIATFYRTRLNQIDDEILLTELEIQSQEEEKRRLNAHLSDRTRRINLNSGEIVVTVDVDNTSRAELWVTYLVSQAGWKAEYDIRADEIDEPLQLDYRASITQNTGEDWQEVNLTLSTGDPSIRISLPELSTQYVDFWQDTRHRGPANRLNATGAVNRAMAPSEMAYGEIDADKAEPDMESLDADREVKTMYTNYKVDRPYSLPSGNKPLNVSIRSQEVAADYAYQTVPKLKDRVFLMAKARDWGNLVLLPGNMNIYYEGGYVGKTFLNPGTTDEALLISLGYDPGIVVGRKLLQDLTSKRTIGTNQREEYAYEITIRNNKNLPVSVKVMDQYPISKHADIKVALLDDASGADINSYNGELSWMIDIPAGEQRKKMFRYEVKYPKNRSIEGL
jgi:uncharacterized protein (TIGR02231 family)